MAHHKAIRIRIVSPSSRTTTICTSTGCLTCLLFLVSTWFDLCSQKGNRILSTSLNALAFATCRTPRSNGVVAVEYGGLLTKIATIDLKNHVSFLSQLSRAEYAFAANTKLCVSQLARLENYIHNLRCIQASRSLD